MGLLVRLSGTAAKASRRNVVGGRSLGPLFTFLRFGIALAARGNRIRVRVVGGDEGRNKKLDQFRLFGNTKRISRWCS
jgi:hypothetical protein